MRVGDGLASRTYTPVEWDAGRGQTRLLTYLHGTGPGSAWCREVATGATCQVVGPRSSLKLDDLDCPLVVVGDETSFALASAWCQASGSDRLAAAVFEVHDADDCGPVPMALMAATLKV